jgi:hypothetical protein
MRSKTILSTAAFIVAFAASAAFANLFVTKTETAPDYIPVSSYKSTSCFRDRNNSTVANKISALIRTDKNNGYESRGEDFRPPFTSSAFSDYAEAVERYVDASSSMKTSDLPGDFETEWREHMKAWRDYSDFLNRMKIASNRAGWSEAELEEVDDFHSSEINRTWQLVLQIGASHGADVY